MLWLSEWAKYRTWSCFLVLPRKVHGEQLLDRFEPMVRSIGDTRTLLQKVLKVIRDPRLAAALINAQVQIRGKAQVPLSVRLIGRIRVRGNGDVEFGESVTLVG